MWPFRRRNSDDPVERIKQYGLAARSGSDRSEFYEFVLSSPIIKEVLTFHGIEAGMLDEYYSRLRLAGAGQMIGGHYVPTSCLANPLALDFICTILKRDDGWDMQNKWLYIASSLVEYVRTGNSHSLEHSLDL